MTFYLHEAQRDGFADELEDPPLGGGGPGELVEGDAGAGDTTGASGEGLQVLEEALVGLDRLACFVPLGFGFGLG